MHVGLSYSSNDGLLLILVYVINSVLGGQQGSPDIQMEFELEVGTVTKVRLVCTQVNKLTWKRAET